jgi:hypothetical protein
MSSLRDGSSETISQLFENITNDTYEKYKTSWDKSPWSYFRKLPELEKLEMVKLFINRLCYLSNVQLTDIHKKSFKISVSISPSHYGVYKSYEPYLLGQSPWKTDYLMFINVYASKIYITLLKNFTESYYRITSSSVNFVHDNDLPIVSIERNKFTKDFFILIEKSNKNHTFVINSITKKNDIELFRQFIHKQIPTRGVFSKTDISYNEQHLRAISNYETFHKLESGTININDVGESSAGVDGWAFELK